MNQQTLLPEESYYLLDNNLITELTRRSYTPAKFPGLHKDLNALINSGKVRSVKEVLREFQEGELKQPDIPLKWCLEHEGMFMPIDDAVDEQLKIVSRHFQQDIIKSIRPYADPHLVAHALAHNSIIVTNESSTPNLNKPRIPEIAAKLNADTCDIWRFFRETGLSKYLAGN